jgi:putative inorganic carbon (HCO3(-)) transporter
MLPITLWASALPDKTLLQVCRLITGIGLFYAIVDWSTTNDKVKMLFLLLPVFGLALAVYGLLSTEWILDKLVFLPGSLYQYLPQIASDTIHPNVLAGSLVILLPAIISLPFFAWNSLDTGRRLLSLVSSIFLTLVIGLTQSRGAILALICSISVLVFLRWRRSWIIFLALFVAAIFGLYLTGPSILIDSASLSTESASKLEGRMEIWSRGIYMIQDFPISGIGMGLYGEVADRIYPFFVNAPDSVPHAHNLFLQVAVDLGIPGFVSWLAVFLIITVASWQLYMKSHSKNSNHSWLAAFGAGFLGSQIALAAHGMLDATTWGMVKSAPLVWSLWGMACAAWIYASQMSIRGLYTGGPLTSDSQIQETEFHAVNL